MPDLLLELGLEEIPARMIASAQAELLKRTLALLTRERLIVTDADAKSYSTPRRLALLVPSVQQQQPDITEDTTGPAVKIAFKDGLPTPAAEAFARKCALTVADLKTIATPKGDYLAATITKRGRTAAEVLADELPKEIAALYWAKNMRWLPASNQTFVRPVLWIACLLGDAVVPVTFGGRTAGRVSYGHRVLSSGEPFEIVAPASYLAQLEGEYVLADVEARRHKIRKALDHVCRTVPPSAEGRARWREDHALVDAVTHLTEWPDVLLGSFEPAYLDLPEEVLVTVMRDHQKYFAIETDTTPGAPHLASEMWETKTPGAPHLDSEMWEPRPKLSPYFLTVTNIALDSENSAIIRQGNERVLRARFNDARFFWEFDQRTPLTDRVKLLENVTFQKDLGSYAAKSERVRRLCNELVTAAGLAAPAVDINAILDAAAFAKTDLTTELVKEFTELQGIIGGLYAKRQGLRDKVADAIYDQYLPASADDRIPRSTEGRVLGLADRIDTIIGMFGRGMEPTGSKDPFALRRAANAVVKILAEGGLPLRLSQVLKMGGAAPEVFDRPTAFFAERVDFYLRESCGQTYDVVKAVMAAGYDDLRDAVARAEAVTAVRGSADFLAVSAAFKRMKNILAQADAQGELQAAATRGQGALHPAEVELIDAAEDLGSSHVGPRTQEQYIASLTAIAALRPLIDNFFSQVMVMDPEPNVRRTRLGILNSIVGDLSTIADFSEIVTPG